MSVAVWKAARDMRGTVSYTIHEHQKPYPFGARFTVSGWWVLKYGPMSLGLFAGAETLEAARSFIPKSYECHPRVAEDPAHVVESWL